MLPHRASSGNKIAAAYFETLLFARYIISLRFWGKGQKGVAVGYIVGLSLPTLNIRLIGEKDATGNSTFGADQLSSMIRTILISAFHPPSRRSMPLVLFLLRFPYCRFFDYGHAIANKFKVFQA